MNPLHLIEGKIRFFRLVSGLPLQLDSPRARVTLLDILKILVTLTLGCVSAILSIVLLVFEYQGTGGLTKVPNNVGYSVIDMVTYDICLAFSSTAAGLLFIAFVKRRVQLGELCGHFETISNKLSLNNAGVCSLSELRGVGKYMKLLIVLAFLLESVGFYFSYEAAIPSGGNVYLHWFYVSLPIWLFTCSWFHPVILGGCLVSFYLLSFHTACFEEYYLQLKQRNEEELREETDNVVTADSISLVGECQEKVNNSTITEQQIKDMIMTGKRLCDITEKVNHTLGPFLIIIFSLCTAAGTALMYGLAGILFGPYLMHKILLALAMGFVGFVYFLTLYYLCSAGQKLEEIRQKAQETLACLLRACYPLGDPLVQYDGTILGQRLGKANPLSPLGFFGMNHSGFLATMSTIFTYLIVMLGFRIDENRSS